MGATGVPAGPGPGSQPLQGASFHHEPQILHDADAEDFDDAHQPNQTTEPVETTEAAAMQTFLRWWKPFSCGSVKDWLVNSDFHSGQGRIDGEVMVTNY